MKTDVQIQQDVIDQLKWEPALNAAEIGVSVKNGVVTLSGIVDTFYKKIMAEQAANKVLGVRAVAEDLQVGVSPAFHRTDAEIADFVVKALKWNTAVPEEKIKVKVEDGVVTLNGEVDWEYQRSMAKTALESIAGIKKINNYVSVNPKSSPSDVKRKILAAFHRSANLDAENISVQVIGTKVILTGKVRSFAERSDAGAAAWAAPGISQVDNQLQMTTEELIL
ncbi:BON domain-containing protein [Pseudoflavitalea rhizosphaerae]|uniref:BON domain-containing protein n=1 Tax=Pseudoflavitalea rhizosphaerae TaxID=1884793 RepID=UPI000F8F1FA5|nr:BON domain-containing protein [Pseudoflavitalea rhizosphaerae]